MAYVEYVRFTNDQQDRAEDCVRAERQRLVEVLANLKTRSERALVRAEIEALGALAELLATPRVTVVMPGARREVEGG